MCGLVLPDSGLNACPPPPRQQPRQSATQQPAIARPFPPRRQAQDGPAARGRPAVRGRLGKAGLQRRAAQAPAGGNICFWLDAPAPSRLRPCRNNRHACWLAGWLPCWAAATCGCRTRPRRAPSPWPCLPQVALDYISLKQCAKFAPKFDWATNSMICAGGCCRCYKSCFLFRSMRAAARASTVSVAATHQLKPAACAGWGRRCAGACLLRVCAYAPSSLLRHPPHPPAALAA